MTPEKTFIRRVREAIALGGRDRLSHIVEALATMDRHEPAAHPAPVVRDLAAANDADGQLVLVRLTGAGALESQPLGLGMPAEDVVPALLGEFYEAVVDLAEAASKAVKDDARVGMYSEALARIEAACDSGSSPAHVSRRISAATARLRESLAGLS